MINELLLYLLERLSKSKNKILENFKKNLLYIKSKNLKIKRIKKIIINTDSEKQLKLQKYKIDYFKRENYFASSKCSNSDF